MAKDQVRERIENALEAPLAGLGLDIEAVELTPVGKHRLLRIAVDKDGGVSMDDIAEASREVSQILDDTNLMGEAAYTLELGSPGVDRPLTLPRHWRRNIGRLVKVSTAANESFAGRIVASDETSVQLDIKGKTRDITLADVTKAKIQIEFNRKTEDTEDEDDD